MITRGFLFMEKFIELHIPILTVSEANCSEHWTAKNKRHQKQKLMVKGHLLRNGTSIPLPCHVKLTRVSPRTLDIGDNLPSAFKWIKDAIADHINPERTIGISKKTGRKVKIAGRSDDDERITWEYDQEKGKPQSIKIDIFA